MKSRNQHSQQHLTLVKHKQKPGNQHPKTQQPTTKAFDPFREDTKKDRCPACAPLIRKLKNEIHLLREQLKQTKANPPRANQTTTKVDDAGKHKLDLSSDKPPKNRLRVDPSPKITAPSADANVNHARVQNPAKAPPLPAFGSHQIDVSPERKKEKTLIVRRRKTRKTRQFLSMVNNSSHVLRKEVQTLTSILSAKSSLLPKMVMVGGLLFVFSVLFHFLFRPINKNNAVAQQKTHQAVRAIPVVGGNPKTASFTQNRNLSTNSAIKTQTDVPKRGQPSYPTQNQADPSQEERTESQARVNIPALDENQPNSLRPDMIRNWIRNASKLIRRKKYTIALARLKRWIRVAPYDPGLRYHYARALSLQNRPQLFLATKQYEKSIEFDSTFAEPYYQLSLLYIQLHEPELAQMALDSYVRLRPEDNRSIVAQKRIYRIN